MKKKKLFVGLLAVSAALGLASCTGDKPDKPDPGQNETQTYTVTFESNGGSSVSSAVTNTEGKISKPADPTWDGHKFIGWYTDAQCEIAFDFNTAITSNMKLYAKWETLPPEVQGYTISFSVGENYGTAPASISNASVLPDTLPTPNCDGYDFLGWYLDEALTNPAVPGTAITQDTTLYADWILENHERVSYNLEVSELDAGKSADPIIVNKYTIGANTEIRNRSKTWTNPDNAEDTKTFSKSIKLGGTADKLTIDAPGAGTLYIYIQNGSSSAETQTVILTKPDATTENLVYPGTSQSSPVVRLEIPVEEGTYTITRTSGTSDIYLAEMNCVVEKSEESGFEIVSDGIVDFIEGQDFDSSKIQLNKVFGNGRTESLSIDDADVVIDSSAYDKTVPGTYEISVKYKDYDAQVIPVTVYEITSLTLGFNQTEKLSTNSAAGNGVYFNQTVQQVYGLNDTFDASYLTVIANTRQGTAEKNFILEDSSLYQINTAGFDSTTAGEKTIVVSVNLNGKNITEEFTVYVVSTEPSIIDEAVQIKVDGTYTGEIGAVVNDCNTFKTIQQALNYLENLGDDYKDTKKIITLAAGTYREKLEVTLPNIEIRGAGKDTTKIEWDSLYGIEDESGYVQVTDSTATLNIRDKAEGFIISGVTVSNYWNSLSVFDEAFGTGYGEHRALALLVQADRFIMKDCALLGYQDTVEFFTGRQYLENTYISGTTDFIFGTNNTTYFKNCQIHSISSGKTDGGYITAFKGCNKGAADYVEYGAIFDGCQFTADADVVAAGNTAIGRPWGAYAAVMVMNSELGGHISTKASTGASKNERYVSMNAKPTDATVKFFEYNNTGDGAIASSIAGVTVLTDASAAALYADYAVIFGTTNGLVNYNLAWDPTSTVPVVDNNVYYYFNGGSSSTGTSYTYASSLGANSADEKTAVLGDLSLDATNGKIVARASDTQINKGGRITFTVSANTAVIISTYPGYHDYTLNGVATSLDTFTQYFAEETTIEFIANNTVYLYSIIIKPNQEAPEEKTLSSLTVSGAKTEFAVGEEFTASGLVVKANYSDGSIVTLTEGDYTVNSDAVDNTAAGVYTIEVSYAGASKSYEITYVASISNVISTNSTYSFNSSDATSEANYYVLTSADSVQGATTTVGKITLDATEGKISDNGGTWFQFNTGSKITFTVAAGATVTIKMYQDATNYTVNGTAGDSSHAYSFTEETEVEIASTANGYIGYIYITFTE